MAGSRRSSFLSPAPDAATRLCLPGPSDDEVDAMLECERYQDENLYGDGFAQDFASPSTPLGQVRGPPEEFFSPGGTAVQGPPPEYFANAEEVHYLESLAPDPEAPAPSGVVTAPQIGGAASSSAASSRPSQLAPVELHRARQKRKATEAELQEQKKRKEFEDLMANTICTGPFVEGLMSFGGRIPDKVYNAMRVKFSCGWREKNKELVENTSGRELVAMIRNKFAKECTWPQKVSILKEIIQEKQQEEGSEAFVMSCKAVLEIIQAKHCGKAPVALAEARAHVVLFVYNDAQYIINELKQEPGRQLDEPSLVSLVRSHPPYMRLKEAFWKFANGVKEKHHCEMAASCEVSPERYASDGTVRIHLSLCLGQKAARLHFRAPYQELAFGRTCPHYAPKCDATNEHHSLKRQGFAKWWGQAAYYLQFPKLFMLDNIGTKQPFKDYPVAQTTIMAYLQAVLFVLTPTRCVFA